MTLVNFLIVFTAQYGFLVSIIVFLLFALNLWLKQRETFFHFFLISLVSFPFSLITAKILSHFIYDPRPFVLEHIKPLIAHAADNGFPSDHTLLTMTIAAIVFIYHRKLGLLLAIIALCIGTTRVLARFHHAQDILGSTIIAFIATYGAYFIFPYVFSFFKRYLP